MTRATAPHEMAASAKLNIAPKKTLPPSHGTESGQVNRGK